MHKNIKNIQRTYNTYDNSNKTQTDKPQIKTQNTYYNYMNNIYKNIHKTKYIFIHKKNI
jgi:hypothetical protein